MKLRTADQILKKDPVVKYHLNQVLKYLKPRRVILFGSKAIGNDTNRSDTDLAVETDEPFITSDMIGALDVVNLKTASKRLKKQISKEGITLYERT
jgi:predicted nucleotidyltransferase